MRHDVRRARLHTINKLVRTSKKLKSKNGSEKEKEKYRRKAARYIEEVSTMKVRMTLKILTLSAFNFCVCSLSGSVFIVDW